RVARGGVEPDELEHELRTVEELGAERRECRAEPAARPGAAKVAVRREIRPRGEAGLELLDRARIGALLRREDARSAALAEERVADVAGDPHRNRERGGVERGDHAGAAVDRRRAADADEDGCRPAAQHRPEELAEAAARGAERVALLADLRQADRLGRVDDRRAVVE